MPFIMPTERLPALPPSDGALHLSPAAAAFLSAIAERDAHLAFVRHVGRGEVHKTFNRDTNAIIGTTPIGVDESLFVKLQSSPFAQYIVVVITCQAMRYPNSASDVTALASGVSIEATLLNHATDAVLDDSGGPGPGVIWQLSDGTLPIAGDSPAIDPNRTGPLLGGFARSYPIFTVGTGWEVDAAPSVFPTPPRPLIVPGSAAGNVLRIEFETTNVRILQVDAWERADPEVEV